MRSRRRRAALGLVLGALLGAVFRLDAASAALLVPLSDEELVAASSFVVRGTVVDVRGVARARGEILTRVRIQVHETILGRVAGGGVVLTEPGGVAGDRAAVIFGAPDYAVGEEVLVFLRRRRDRTLLTTALGLGKYRIERDRGGRWRAVPSAAVAASRDLEPFVAGVHALAAARPPELQDLYSASSTDGDAVDEGGGPVVGRFTFLGPPQQLPARWFEPDRGLPVRLLVVNRDTALGREESDRVLAEAFAAWSGVPGARIVLENGGLGARARSVAGGVCDDRSNVQFNDPFDEIPDLTGTCRGVLAVGGFCTSPESIRLGGTTFLRISEGDATINNGVGDCVRDTRDLIETVAHELGHTIGLGHSSESASERDAGLRDALMYAFAHHDGRGAALNADDVAGVSALYPTGTPLDGDADGVPDERDRCPTTPAGRVVDTDGCACTDADASPCEDGNPCTIDRCDDTNGACVYLARSCTDENPCTVDRCDAFSGLCLNQLRGDSDADGVCDPIDNCPLQPDADAADRDGNGVGDVCECGDLAPGRCVPGRGAESRRCFAEWMPEVLSSITRGGLRSAQLACADGDAACDADDVAGQCTFRIALCINNQDPRFPRCFPLRLRELAVRSPKPTRPKDAADVVNAASLSTALDLLGGAIDLDSQGLNLCSDHLPIVVPTQGARAGGKRLFVRTTTIDGRRGKAKLALRCLAVP
jgi:hypothetical protein